MALHFDSSKLDEFSLHFGSYLIKDKMLSLWLPFPQEMTLEFQIRTAGYLYTILK